MDFMHPPAGYERHTPSKPKWRPTSRCREHNCRAVAVYELVFEHNGAIITAACERHKAAQAKAWG